MGSSLYKIWRRENPTSFISTRLVAALVIAPGLFQSVHHLPLYLLAYRTPGGMSQEIASSGEIVPILAAETNGSAEKLRKQSP